LGTAIAEVLVGLSRVPFLRLGIPDEFVPVGPPAALYAHYGLDAPGICRSVSAFLKKSQVARE
jgi:transketolase